MNILLIAPDSKFPNLAMMKLAAYHKAKGDIVGFGVSNPDRIYASILFTKHKHWAKSWAMMYPGIPIIIGGPGYDPCVRLPEEIERMPPDQSLYESPYSIGRVTSGCPNDCYFCIVPKMEPEGIRYIQHPCQIWKPGTVLRLLDDNILALPYAFDEIHEYCTSGKVPIRFEYLDARLITHDQAVKLKEMRHEHGNIYFSWDMTRDEPMIKEAFETLESAGWRLNATHWFIYLHNEAAIPDAMHRFETIRQLGGEPFLMVNNDNRSSELRRIARRGCRPAIWRNLEVAEVFA